MGPLWGSAKGGLALHLYPGEVGSREGADVPARWAGLVRPSWPGLKALECHATRRPVERPLWRMGTGCSRPIDDLRILEFVTGKRSLIRALACCGHQAIASPRRTGWPEHPAGRRKTIQENRLSPTARAS